MRGRQRPEIAIVDWPKIENLNFFKIIFFKNMDFAANSNLGFFRFFWAYRNQWVLKPHQNWRFCKIRPKKNFRPIGHDLFLILNLLLFLKSIVAVCIRFLVNFISGLPCIIDFSFDSNILFLSASVEKVLYDRLDYNKSHTMSHYLKNWYLDLSMLQWRRRLYSRSTSLPSSRPLAMVQIILFFLSGFNR